MRDLTCTKIYADEAAQSQTGEEILRPVSVCSCVNSVAFLPNGSKITAGSDDGKVRVFDSLFRYCESNLDGHTSSVMLVCFDHTGGKLASCGGYGDISIGLWSTEIGAPIGSPLSGHLHSVRCLAFKP